MNIPSREPNLIARKKFGIHTVMTFAATLYLEAAKCNFLETSAQMQLKDR